MNRKTLHWWSKLDSIMRMAAMDEIISQKLLEIDNIASAYSHPGRTADGEIIKAIHEAWQVLILYHNAQEGVDNLGGCQPDNDISCRDPDRHVGQPESGAGF